MKITMVGGTWDENGGKPSKIINAVFGDLFLRNESLVSYNGGSYNDLSNVWVRDADIILWFPNIPNHLKKDNIKQSFPKAIVVTSKNNYDKNYSFQELVAHALALKSNLFIEITKDNGVYHGQLFDPLGNAWCQKTKDFVYLVRTAIDRAKHLCKITRKSTVQSPELPKQIPLTEENKKFFKVVQNSANTFHKLIHPADGVKRFLGNASFRCMNGFPSLKSDDGCIYVSRRNVDKRALGPDEFVQVGYNAYSDTTWYRGDHKPSVDTVVQVQLYRKFPSIRYMIHSHVYVEHKWHGRDETGHSDNDAPFTRNMVPCGGLEEVHEIMQVMRQHKIRPRSAFAINLIGHGSLICAQSPEDFELFDYRERPSPEIMYA